jgi:DNA-binding transcriptional regulator LsrR (DeoR family)
MGLQMKKEDRLALLYKVAQLHYEEGMKKYEIGNIVRQSPTQVANLLKEAEEAGIVRIRVTLPRLKTLQEKLKSKFSLRDVVVIPFESNCPALLKMLSQAAAEYFDDKVSDGSKVGLGGGYLIYEMVNLLPERIRDLKIFPAAIIARGPEIGHIDPMTVGTLLWAKSGHLKQRAHCVTVTPLDRPANLSQLRKHYQELMRNNIVKDLLESMKTVDWLFASIGGLDADEAYVAATNYSTRNLLSEIQLDDANLRKEGVVGDIVYSFFDRDGNTKPQWNAVATLGVNQVKLMAADPTKRVVVVVGGYKLRALQAVLRGRLCNVLITDAGAAELILESA